jgi:hypothetical protein
LILLVRDKLLLGYDCASIFDGTLWSQHTDIKLTATRSSSFWLLIRMRNRRMCLFYYRFGCSRGIEVDLLEAGSVICNDSCPRASKRRGAGTLG